jgi:ATP-dependent DNA ligase
LDGFRCVICTHGRFLARSRRGWNMSTLLPELGATLPANLQLDGEIVALNAESARLSPARHRMLHGQGGVQVTYFVFDVLAVEGLPTTAQSYTRAAPRSP